MVDGGKVAGILPESSIGADGKAEHVVAGHRRQCRASRPSFPRCATAAPASAARSRRRWSGWRAAWRDWLAQWRRDGFAAMRAEWLAKAGPLGLRGRREAGRGAVRGRFAGHGRRGRLAARYRGGPAPDRRRRVAGPRGLKDIAMLLAIKSATPTPSSPCTTASEIVGEWRRHTDRPCARPTSTPSGCPSSCTSQGIDRRVDHRRRSSPASCRSASSTCAASARATSIASRW